MNHSWKMVSVAMGLVTLIACGALVGPGDLVVSDPISAVAQAQNMIEAKNRVPEKFDGWIEAKDLPSALRIKNLHHAVVHSDHVDLVLARNPDWSVGGRIWAKSHRAHNDTPSRYPGIYFYAFTNDNPESLDNIP